MFVWLVDFIISNQISHTCYKCFYMVVDRHGEQYISFEILKDRRKTQQIIMLKSEKIQIFVLFG